MSSFAARVRTSARQQLQLLLHLSRWIVLGVIVGGLAGMSTWVFLKGLDRVIEFRVDGRQWLVYFLPLAGLGMGLLYHRVGGRSAEGNNLLLDEIHEPSAWVPRRMAPLVLIGTWVSHLFGASVGREGTAMQMSGSLGDALARAFRLRSTDRRIVLITAMAGGFGAVFGVPVAGAVFALEVQAIGRLTIEAAAPALTASIVGDRVVRALGVHHELYPALSTAVTPWLLIRIAVAGLAFGLCGACYATLTHAIKRMCGRTMKWPPLHPFVGGLLMIVLVWMFGHAYQGLSLPLIGEALSGRHLGFEVFALKLLFTAVSLGFGFVGGEVTPLFVMGATLGSALALPLGLNGQLISAVGFCAVFAGASNTPIASTILGVELFGSGAITPIAVGCVIAYVFSGHSGIYTSQRVHVAKVGSLGGANVRLRDWRRGEGH